MLLCVDVPCSMATLWVHFQFQDYFVQANLLCVFPRRMRSVDCQKGVAVSGVRSLIGEGCLPKFCVTQVGSIWLKALIHHTKNAFPLGTVWLSKFWVICIVDVHNEFLVVYRRWCRAFYYMRSVKRHQRLPWHSWFLGLRDAQVNATLVGR